LGTDTDELEATLAEPDPTPTAASDEKINMLALAEAVARISQSAEQTNQNTNKVLHELAGASVGIQKQAHSGVTKALVKFDKESRALEAKERSSEQRSNALKHKGYLWLMLGVVSGVLVFGALALASYLFYAPKIAEYQAYRNTHQVIEDGSVFGAEVIRNENGVFVVFDDDVETRACSQPNCIGLTY